MDSFEDLNNMAIRIRLSPRIEYHTSPVSNKEKLSPRDPKPEPSYTIAGWHNGYEFRQFLGNCYAWLGEIANEDGMQQLCHQYYLQNGSLGARSTATRIKKFLGI